MDRFANSNVITAIFQRRKGDARTTKLFRDLTETQQRLLLELARLDAGETPIIAYLGGDTSWCLVTNGGLVWLDVDGIHRASIFDVTGLTHDMGTALRRGHLDKRQFDELTVHIRGREPAVIQLEAGAPFYAVWRALDWMLDWATRPHQNAVRENRVA